MAALQCLAWEISARVGNLSITVLARSPRLSLGCAAAPLRLSAAPVNPATPEV